MARKEQLPGYDISRLRILVLEKFYVMRILYRSVLRAFNVREVVDSADFEGAWQSFNLMYPDIILVDWSPGFDGLDFLRRLRGGDSKDRTIPVILMSPYTRKEDIVRARDAGATDFLAKPVTAEALYRRICAVIDNRRPFVDAPAFFGPDRRRQVREFKGENRRQARKDGNEPARAVEAKS